MRKQRNGNIVNISSIVGRFGVPLNAAYVSSKFALEGLSESISFELQEFGIKVILVEPGVIQTHFFQNLKIRGNDTKSPYYKLMDIRIAFLKAAMKNSVSSSDQVANTILNAVNSRDPDMRLKMVCFMVRDLQSKALQISVLFLDIYGRPSL